MHSGLAATAQAGAEHGASLASEVVSSAVEAAAVLLEATMAKGLGRLRRWGWRPPGALGRRLRELDAGAALLRHPGAAEAYSGAP